MYRIYKNLHKDCFSIQAKIPGKGWRVVDYAKSLSLSNVTFRVYEAGRQRVIRTGKKNVHAFVLADSYERPDTSWEAQGCDVKVRYNPKLAHVFLAGDTEVRRAARAHLTDGAMYVSEDWS